MHPSPEQNQTGILFNSTRQISDPHAGNSCTSLKLLMWKIAILNSDDK